MDVLISEVAVDLISNKALLELHLVLGQCASLVAKNELDLAKLFNKVTISAQGKVHVLRIGEEHLDVIVDNLCLDQLQHLNNDVQRDRNHMTVGHLIRKELQNPSSSIKTATDVKIDVLLIIIVHPDQGQSSPDADDQELEGKDGVK